MEYNSQYLFDQDSSSETSGRSWRSFSQDSSGTVYSWSDYSQLEETDIDDTLFDSSKESILKKYVEKPELSCLTDGTRLWNDIHHTARWGAIPENSGMARLALSDEDKMVRDYFVAEAKEVGCSVKIDQMGNIFAILDGENPEVPPIGLGSHLDTQPAGGRYDGVLGVLSALEVLRTIKESGTKTYAPIAAINWTNEEGARFNPGCSGSAVWASHTPIQQAHTLSDISSTCTMRRELERINYFGPIMADHKVNQLSAHFELHIEQGRILQDTNRKIGIVTNIQGIRWFKVQIHGERAHAGAAVMETRADSLVASSKLVLFLTGKAVEVGAVATVGVLELDRPSSNTVPGEADFTIDLRHRSEAVLDKLESEFRGFFKEMVAKNEKLSVDVERVWHSPAVNLDQEAMACSQKAAEKVVGNELVMELMSYAGHDSALTAIQVPTSMIFVPCKDGISHSPDEYLEELDCSLGVQVLLQATLEYDALLKVKNSTRT